MKISHEIPIELLPISLSFNDYDYALVHLFDTHKTYRDFYFQSVGQGRHVLLDNSLFELKASFDPERYLYWIKRLNPTEFIVPDVLDDYHQTIESFQEFMNFEGLPATCKIIAVNQGETFGDLMLCYRAHLQEECISKIAFPFQCKPFQNPIPQAWEELKDKLNIPKEWIENSWGSQALNRIYFLWTLKQNGLLTKSKKHHLLGCSVPWEFAQYKKLGLDSYIETVDTSNPVVAGILGYKYQEPYGVLDKWPCILVDFIEHTLREDQRRLVFQNITLFRKFIHGRVSD